MELAIIGPPGSGKSTLANSLAVHHEMEIISSGNIAREMKLHDPDVSDRLEEGKPAPEAQMRNAVAERIHMVNTNFILEGFPRTIAQYIFLRQMEIDPITIWLDVPQVTCIERMLKRERDDDTPDAMTERLTTYFTQTIDLIQILLDDYKLIKIDASDIDAEQVRHIANLRLERYQ